MKKNSSSEALKGISIDMAGHIEYSSGSVVSKTLLNKATGTITLFAFDKGQGLSEHTAPFDATVVIIEGSSQITIGGRANTVKKGVFIIMPANVPHSLKALKKFKMLLIMIRK